MAQGSGFQLLIMTDLYPATTLSFLHFFCLHSLCLALIMSFTCSVVASLGSLVAAPILRVLLFSFCCSTICLKKKSPVPFPPPRFSKWCPVVQWGSKKEQSHFQLPNAGQSTRREPGRATRARAAAAEIWDHAVFCRFGAQVHQGGRRRYARREKRRLKWHPMKHT